MFLQDFHQPEFFLAEIPVKDGSINDKRQWIYSRLSLSLIEFVKVDNVVTYHFKNKQKKFSFQNSHYVGVFAQNNCEATENDEDEILNKSWEFYKQYLKSKLTK